MCIIFSYLPKRQESYHKFPLNLPSMTVGLHFGRDDSFTRKAALHIAEYLVPLATGIKASENPSAILTPETKRTKKYLLHTSPSHYPPTTGHPAQFRNCCSCIDLYLEC